MSSPDLAAEFEELGRFISDFSMLEKSLHLLCATLVMGEEAAPSAHERVELLAAEVDVTRLCRFLSRLFERFDERSHSTWEKIESRIQRENQWRVDVAHSWWALEVTDNGYELRREKRGAVVRITASKISEHGEAVQKLYLDVLTLRAAIDPESRVHIGVEPSRT